ERGLAPERRVPARPRRPPRRRRTRRPRRNMRGRRRVPAPGTRPGLRLPLEGCPKFVKATLRNLEFLKVAFTDYGARVPSPVCGAPTGLTGTCGGGPFGAGWLGLGGEAGPMTVKVRDVRW